MDAANNKEVTVKRGYKYRYYFAAASGSKPTLLFLHGFPSTAYDWRKQIAFFQPLGYGIIAPDLLGSPSSGTAKPLDVKEFRMAVMAADVIDILDAENVTKVVGIAHDWGSGLLSWLCALHQDRFLAFSWLAVGYTPPNATSLDLEAFLARLKAAFGSEIYAYWRFFTKPHAHEVISANIDSFFQVFYTDQHEQFGRVLSAPGGLEKFLNEGTKLGVPAYLSDEEYEATRRTFVEVGVRSHLLWYNAQVENANVEDAKGIPPEQLVIRKPAFFGMAMRDGVCRPVLYQQAFQKFGGTNVRSVEFDAGHWLQLQRAQECNEALNAWLEEVRVE